MKIMIDAGHGYSTAGKRSPSGFREYEFTRKVALFARSLLEGYQNVTVYFAHSDSRDVPLQERTDAANRLNVDAYVSIHGNAYSAGYNNAGGIETYVYLTRPREAVQLAEKIQHFLVTMTGLQNRGVKTADFHVLRETKMTAVLAECGFYTNQTEESLMRTDQFQRTCAEAIVKGIVEQYHLTPKQTPPAPSPSGKLYKVQAGAFTQKSNADQLAQRLKAAGFEAIINYTPSTSTSTGLYKVQSGAFTEKQNAEALAQRLKNAGFEAFIHLE